jgi:hypothetical protein
MLPSSLRPSVMMAPTLPVRFQARPSLLSQIATQEGLPCIDCGEKLTPALHKLIRGKPVPPMAPTIEHLTPNHQGKQEGWAAQNYALGVTHYKCNNKRGPQAWEHYVAQDPGRLVRTQIQAVKFLEAGEAMMSATLLRVGATLLKLVRRTQKNWPPEIPPSAPSAESQSPFHLGNEKPNLHPADTIAGKRKRTPVQASKKRFINGNEKVSFKRIQDDFWALQRGKGVR